MQISIRGQGNFELIKPIEFKIDGVKIFSQKPIQHVELSKSGYKGEWSQNSLLYLIKVLIFQKFL